MYRIVIVNYDFVLKEMPWIMYWYSSILTVKIGLEKHFGPGKSQLQKLDRNFNYYIKAKKN